MTSIAQSLYYHNYIWIDRVGLAGGLLLMWKDGITCDIASSADNIIHALIRIDLCKPEVLMYFMYDSTYNDPKKKQWNFLHELSEVVYQPWLVLGDLNFYLARNCSSSDTWVQNKVRDIGLSDLGYEGNDYTWTSNSFGTGIRKARLDMGLGNTDWFLQFPNAKICHLNHIASDHCPIMLITDPIPKKFWRPFKNFGTWMKHDSFKSNMEQAWNIDVQGSPSHKFRNKLQHTRFILARWNKLEFGDIHKNIKILQDKLDIAQKEPTSISQEMKVKNITHDLENWYKIQTSFYKEKSRDKHIHDMDNNTKYFHSIVNKRLHRNNISALIDNEGNKHRDRDSISNLLTTHFSTIACTSNPVLTDAAFDVIHAITNDSDNEVLLAVPSADEITSVVKSMPAWSSLGPDGFQAGFYQSQWDIVGKDVIDVVQKFFITGFMPKDLNKTYIGLIPKVKDPKKPS
ncbi:uncharacterized protein LOC113315639 [Papaver somniferum]|uniref:uncharacterized protein LOC113315639 n=1 Tax=Papaver somniferum TaxID=3469 RepID=UPI000E7008FE|nr:uncharacterized protein LOC113315639 [Papaver somniferum]